MRYKVLDPKGIGYMDDKGKIIIACGATLEDRLIEKGLFTRECVEGLIKSGRLEGKADQVKAPAVPIASPSDKKAKIPSAKKGGKKK